MEAFALYLLKSVIWLSGFALVYILFLRNERFFLLNRLYLIAGVMTSFFFPLISVHYTVVLPLVKNIQTDNTIVSGIQNVSYNNTPDTGLLLLTLYLSGVLFVSITMIKQSKSVLKAIKKAEIITSHPVKLIRTAEYTSSFSFFSYVFVNPSITDVETKEIVNHELVHIRQRHWFDLVLVELLCILQWFNPLVWIYIRFIRQNHEYLADEMALQRTSDPAIYRAALLNQIVGAPVVSLANSFNYSLNKKRFNMMKNIISSPYRKMKVLFVLPLFAIVFYAFAMPEYDYTTPSNNTMAIYQSQAIISREVRGVVVQQDGKPLQGATIVVKGTTLGVSSDAKGFFRLSNVPEEAMLAVSYVGFKFKVVKPDFASGMTITMMRDTVFYGYMQIIRKDGKEAHPLIMLDGVTTDIDVNKIDPETIESIDVLKNESAIALYGEKAKDGVILITTKKKDSQITREKLSDVQVVGYAKDQKADKDLFVIVEEIPEFPGGGKEAMWKWISENLKYPAEAVKDKITGKVNVNFIVSSTGKVKDVKVTKAVHPLLDAEARKVISNMPDWKPGSQAGKPVDVQMMVPVEFKLD